LFETGRSKALTEGEVVRIHKYHELEFSERQISEKIDTSQNAIHNVLALGDNYNQKYTSGRPKATTALDERQIVALAKKKTYSIRQIVNAIPRKLSFGTINGDVADTPFVKWCKKIG